MTSTDADADRPAVNYMTASRIALRFEEGQVANVEADGPVEGIHLEPVRAASASDEEAAEDDDSAPSRATSSRGPGASP